ncbi:MAG: acyltransferase, partial [Nocardioides sp.]
MSSRSADGYRADIQGLRAVAVLLVVLFHLWPHRLSGGFVGVDVFFVISGYLITRHLAQEVERTGRLKVWRFWARRARRLLPAALLVLLASLAMAWRWLPQTQWEATVRQVRASALYVQNWALARDAVDYSALNADATVAQHYWSLSVEEQFYFVWPLLIMVLLLAGVALARLAPSLGGSAPSRRLLMAGGLTTLGVASFGYSILSTSSDQAVAYFATPTRVWEFALGGVIGIYWTGRRLQGPAAVAAAWAGLGAIGWAALN